MSELLLPELRKGQLVMAVKIAVKHGWDQAQLLPGTCGRVAYTDSQGTIHVRWDDGHLYGVRPQDGDELLERSTDSRGAAGMRMTAERTAISNRLDDALRRAGPLPLSTSDARKAAGLAPELTPLADKLLNRLARGGRIEKWNAVSPACSPHWRHIDWEAKP